MVALNTAYAPSKPLEQSQNRVGDFFREGTDCLGTNRHSTRNRTGENRVNVTIIVSGRSSWLSRDPIAENGGINLYAYVLNNPINYWDPLALRWYHDAAIGTLNVVEGGLNVVSGVADTATFGFTDWASNELNDLIYGEEVSDEAERRRKCSKAYKAGQIGGLLVPAGAGVAGAARLAGPGSKLLGKGSKLFGRGGRHGHKGLLNRGPVRTGWGWNGSRDVFRTSWAPRGGGNYRNHLDWF